MNFRIGQYYSRREIHEALGGELETYLPQRDGKIVCGCFTEELGPEVPNTILVGNAPRVIEKAKTLIGQAEPIKVFIKRSINKWQYAGTYRASGFSIDPLILEQAEMNSRRSDLAMVLYLQRTDAVSRHFLHYWKPSTADLKIGNLLDHIASDQFTPRLIKRNDAIWAVTSRNGTLSLLGRLIVGCIIEGQKEAERHWNRKNLWESYFHIAPEPGTEEYSREIDISDIVASLRFESKDADRLTVVGGRVNGQQLQRVRRLTVESVALLETKWGGVPSAIKDEYARAIAVGGGFGDPAKNKEVEKAAINQVRYEYESKGWYVESVEAKKVGFDLLCRSGSKEEHVEVKGVQGKFPSFIITEGECQRANNDPAFVLYVVTNTLTEEAQPTRYTATEFLERFSRTPIAYRAILES